MKITEKMFFEDVLDLTIPELKLASEAHSAGNAHEARRIFASYVKGVLMPEKFFKIPFYEQYGACIRSGETLIDQANRVLENKYIAVNVPYDFGKGNKIDWWANPCYNKYKEWGVQFHRHHEWRALGHAYRETGDEKYAECFARLVRSWITEAEQYPEGDPPHPSQGLHWRTIECGIRMTVSWHYAIHACMNSPAIDDELWTLIFMSVWEHALRLRTSTAGFNWLTMELNGLTRISLCYPFFREAKSWFDYATKRFISEADDQFHPDYMQAELTTGYHGAVVGNFLGAFDAILAYGVTPPKEFLDGIHKMFYMYSRLCMPDRSCPALNDSGKPSVIKQCALGLKYFPEDDVLRYFATDSKEGHEPDYKSIILPYSGMFVMRTGWSRDDMWAFFESAPFGASHQHEDKLNFLLYAYGTDMLPDTGVFRYDTSDMRGYVLGTRSHNTGLVDGLPQNRRQKYVKIKPHEMHNLSDLVAKIGEETEVADGIYNEGYGPELVSATHRRRVVFFKNGLAESKPFFLVIDRYSAEEEHTFETSFQLTTAPITVEGHNITATYKTGATLTMVSSAYPTVTVGQFTPEFMGWRPDHTPEAKVHFPAPIVAYKSTGTEAYIATVLYPAPDSSECPISSVSADKDGFSVTVNGVVEYFSYDDELVNPAK